ncbi:MAG: DUF3810 domain-containing protein, partial [Oscillospiraceae bacterium]|nr:DUF3810 domain-containing protein [Oscillospiraceae bacterium]
MFKLRAGRKIITRAVWSVGLAGLCGLLLIVAKAAPEGTALVFGPWSRWVSGTLGWVFSFTKLAVAEWLLYALVVGLPLGLLSMAFRALRRRSVWPLLTGLSRAALGAVSIGTAFFLLWGLNYFNPPLAGRLTVEPVPR